MTRIALLLTTALVLAVSAAAPAAADAASTDRARNLLRGKMFTRYAAGFDQRLHLCSNGRFIYDTVSGGGEGLDPDVRRVEGRWRVLSARIARGSATARVHGVPDEGGRGLTLTFAATPRRMTINGLLAWGERSDLCR